MTSERELLREAREYLVEYAAERHHALDHPRNKTWLDALDDFMDRIDAHLNAAIDAAIETERDRLGAVLAVGEPCAGYWHASEPQIWICRCGAKSPRGCITETAERDEGGK